MPNTVLLLYCSHLAYACRRTDRTEVKRICAREIQGETKARLPTFICMIGLRPERVVSNGTHQSAWFCYGLRRPSTGPFLRLLLVCYVMAPVVYFDRCRLPWENSCAHAVLHRAPEIIRFLLAWERPSGLPAPNLTKRAKLILRRLCVRREGSTWVRNGLARG